jgi:beta-ureidopropionase / N-carbamoyl-L-amino-acid hydrolase
MYKCDAKRMEDKIKTFSTFGDAGHGGITRYALSPEDQFGAETNL